MLNIFLVLIGLLFPVHLAPPITTTTTTTVQRSTPSTVPQARVSYGGSGFMACVIRTESAGQAQVMNSSGHYGLFQMTSTLWAAGGGAPADFGHAPVSEQYAVFDNIMAHDINGGSNNWSPYDGCWP